MKNQFGVKMWVNRFQVKEMLIEFVINNSLQQRNNFKIKHITLKVKEIRRDCRFIHCEINGIVPNIYLALSDAYSEPSQPSKVECYRLNTVKVFRKKLHLRYLTGF